MEGGGGRKGREVFMWHIFALIVTVEERRKEVRRRKQRWRRRWCSLAETTLMGYCEPIMPYSHWRKSRTHTHTHFRKRCSFSWQLEELHVSSLFHLFVRETPLHWHAVPWRWLHSQCVFVFQLTQTLIYWPSYQLLTHKALHFNGWYWTHTWSSVMEEGHRSLTWIKWWHLSVGTWSLILSAKSHFFLAHWLVKDVKCCS